MRSPDDAAMRSLLERGMNALQLATRETDVDRLLQYVSLLDRWNTVHNLTAVRDPSAMLTQHLLDSMAIQHLIPLGATVLDVGTGAGLPGIPLTIIRDDLSMTMVDSNGKKTAFVQHAINALQLTTASTLTTRVDAWHPPHPFQIIVSRALSDLLRFIKMTRHLLAPGGQWIAMKGQRPDKEIAALPDDIATLDVPRLLVPMLDGERHAVVMAPRTSPTERFR